MYSRKSNFPISLKSVDEISEIVQNFLLECKVEQGISLRMGLVVEETLISLAEKIEGDREIEVTLSKRLGKPWITMTYGGDRIDPTDKQDGDMVSELILNRLGIQPKWNYRNRLNRITLSVPSSGIKTEFQLLGALVLAVLLGVCAPMIPAGIKDVLSQYLLTPISDIFLKLLMTLAPMLIFLSVINSVIRTGQGADFGRIGKYVITRYLVISTILGSIYTIVLIPFFHLHFEDKVSMSNSFQKLYDIVINIIPGNIVLPFSENNTLQIIVLALFLGVVIVNLDNRLETLQSTMLDLYSVFMSGIEIICRFLPLFIFASLLKLFWQTGFGDFSKLWKPIFAAALVSYAYVLVAAIWISAKYKVSVSTLFRKVFPLFLIGLTTSSSLMAMPKGLEINKKRLGISERYTNLAYPLGINLFSATFSSLTISITYYLAETYHVAVSPVWFFTSGLMCIILSIANPPVSGGVLVSLGIIFTQLNIPNEGLAIAGTLALIMDFIICASKIVSHQFEMTVQADHLDMLDKDTLKDPEKM